MITGVKKTEGRATQALGAIQPSGRIMVWLLDDSSLLGYPTHLQIVGDRFTGRNVSSLSVVRSSRTLMVNSLFSQVSML